MGFSRTKYQKKWDELVITPSRMSKFRSTADKCLKNKAMYQRIADAIGCPWYIPAVIHYREASFRMNVYLHNGDPLFNKNGKPVKTVHVPKNVGPFTPQDFETAAIHALSRFKKNKDWSIAKILYLLEAYNGMGYANRGVPSPYLWSSTNQYTKGRYIADHVFDPESVSTRTGLAGVIKLLLEKEDYVLPPSNPHLNKWNPQGFINKLTNLIDNPTPARIKDMKEVVLPSAIIKINKLLEE